MAAAKLSRAAAAARKVVEERIVERVRRLNYIRVGTLD